MKARMVYVAVLALAVVGTGVSVAQLSSSHAAARVVRSTQQGAGGADAPGLRSNRRSEQGRGGEHHGVGGAQACRGGAEHAAHT